MRCTMSPTEQAAALQQLEAETLRVVREAFEIARRSEVPILVVVDAQTGSGKSRCALELLTHRDVFACESHSHVLEKQNSLPEEVPSRRLRSITAPLTDEAAKRFGKGSRCHRFEAARQLESAGHSARVLCGDCRWRSDFQGDDSRVACPFQGGVEGASGPLFTTHAALPIAAEMASEGVHVVDELPPLEERISVSAAVLAELSYTFSDPVWTAWLKPRRDAFRLLREALERQQPKADLPDRVREALRQLHTTPPPDVRIPGGKEPIPARIDEVLRIACGSRDGRVRTRCEEDGPRELVAIALNTDVVRAWGQRVVILDATAAIHQDRLRHMAAETGRRFELLQVPRIADRLTRYVYPLAAATRSGMRIDKGRLSRNNIIKPLTRCLDLLHSLGVKRLGFIGYKALINALFDRPNADGRVRCREAHRSQKDAFAPFDEVRALYYGGQRSSNRLEHCDALLLFGEPTRNFDEVEHTEKLFGVAPGSLWRAHLESETEQAVGRLRGVRRAAVVLFVARPATIDAQAAWRDATRVDGHAIAKTLHDCELTGKLREELTSQLGAVAITKGLAARMGVTLRRLRAVAKTLPGCSYTTGLLRLTDQQCAAMSTP